MLDCQGVLSLSKTAALKKMQEQEVCDMNSCFFFSIKIPFA